VTALADVLKRNKGLLAALLVLAAALLRVAFAGRFAFFIDELHAVNFTRGGLGHAMRMLSETPGTAPLDYALVNLLQRVSLSESWMRLPYALFGAWSVYLTYALGARWFSRAHGLMASGLLAFSTAHIYYSQSIRCYSLNILLLLLAAHACDRLIHDADRRAGVQLAVISLLAVLNQFFALMPLGFLLMAGAALSFTGEACAAERRTRLTWLTISGACMAVVFAMCWKLILMPKNLGVFRGSDSVLSLVLQAIRAIAMFTSFSNLLLNILVLLLALIGLIHLIEKRPRLLALFAAVMLLPAPLIVFQEMRLKSGVQLRHLVYMAPFYFLAASCGLVLLCGWLGRAHAKCRGLRWVRTNWLSRDSWLVALCAWIALMMAGSTAKYFTSDFEQRGEPDFRPDWRVAARHIADHSSKDDILVAAGIGNGPWRYCIDFYLRQYNEPRTWAAFENIDNLNSPHANGRVRFVYFDLPVRYHRNFSSVTDKFDILPVNTFVTLFSWKGSGAPASKHSGSPGSMPGAAETFALLVTPPTDFGIYSQAWTDLGIAMRGRDLNAAQEYQERAVAVAETSPLNLIFDEIRAREELGETYFQQGKRNQAMEQWEAAAALIPHRISRALLVQLDYHPERLYCKLARGAAQQNDIPEALEHARAALRYNADYTPAKSLLQDLERKRQRRP
jgi:hypothetical protein